MSSERTLRVDTRGQLFEGQHEKLMAFLAKGGETREVHAVERGALCERYDPAVCSIARETWRGRMVNEHRSSSVFAALVPQLIEASVTVDAQTAALRMGMDEIHHAVLCGRVLTAFGGDPTAQAEGELPVMPRHPGTSPIERVMRNVMFVGCLSETVAVALVGEERELATEPMVRAALDQILSDEVQHARYGWAFVGQCLGPIDGDARGRTERWLRTAFAFLERKELEHMPLTPPSTGEIRAQREAAGLCEPEHSRGLLYDAIREVIVPGLEGLGLAAGEAWARRAEA